MYCQKCGICFFIVWPENLPPVPVFPAFRCLSDGGIRSGILRYVYSGMLAGRNP